MGMKVYVTTWVIAQLIQMAFQIACGKIDSSKKMLMALAYARVS
jgi:hypothetical protein